MAVRVVRLGTSRAADEGIRIGTVRRPPRGVPKAAFASQNWYDVWLPNLAPSVETMKLGQEATTPAQWTALTALIERTGGFRYARERAAGLAAESRSLLASERAGVARRALDAAVDYAIQRDR